MNLDGLIEQVLDDYYSAELSEEPVERLTSLRDIVVRRWTALDAGERLALAEEADETERLVLFDRREGEVGVDEIDDVEDEAADALVHLIRTRIPELSILEF